MEMINVHYTFSVKAMRKIMLQSCLHPRSPAAVLEEEDSLHYFSFPLPRRIQPRTLTHQPTNLLLIVLIPVLSHTRTALELFRNGIKLFSINEKWLLFSINEKWFWNIETSNTNVCYLERGVHAILEYIWMRHQPKI